MSDKQRGTNPQNRDVNASNRVALAMKLRASKMTYEAIAHQCGYSNASVCRKAILRELDRVVVTNVEQLRKEELHTLDMLQQECMKRMIDKNHDKAMLFAVDRILSIMERRARLMGLDTPIDQAVAMNQVIIRELPSNYLGIVEHGSSSAN